MKKYIRYIIELQENVILGEFAGQDSLAYSFDYVTGSAIRGAMIYRFMRNKQYSEKEVYDKIIAGDIEFLNAYIGNGDNRALPAIAGLYASKNDMKLKKDTKVFSQFEKEREVEGLTRLKTSNFISVQEDNIMQWPVEKKEALHIKVNNYSKGSTKEKGIYKYESIVKGQSFIGYIAYEDKEVGKMLFDELNRNKKLFIGSSRSSGYGKCCIKDIAYVEGNPEIKGYVKEDIYDGEFYIVYLSDMIYKNELGQSLAYIDEKLLSEKLGVSCCLKEYSSEAKVISGFNNKLGGRLPNYNGTKAGSVFLYSYEGQIDVKKIEAFANESYGEKTKEGFGRISIAPCLKFSKVIYKQSNIEKRNEYQLPSLDRENKQFLKGMLKNVYFKRLEENIDHYLLALKSIGLNSTNLSKWRGFIQSCYGKDADFFNERVLEVEKHINDSTNDRKKRDLNKLMAYRLQGSLTIKQFMENMNNFENLKQLELLPEDINIGNVSGTYDKKDIFFNNVYFLDSLIYRLIQIAKEGEV